MSTTRKRLWLQISVVAVLASVGVVQYQLQANKMAVGGAVALQRLDLLYLNEAAPGLRLLGVPSGTKAVVVFCQTCSQPLITGAQVVRSTDRALANQYGLVKDNAQLGPGYVIINSLGKLRYRSYDNDPAGHQGEINRLVRGVE